MKQGLLTIRDVTARELGRMRLARQPKLMGFPKRSLDELNVDEANITTARHAYVILAEERAKSHSNAAPMLDEIYLLHLQEIALREAAEMLNARIRSRLRDRRPPGRV